MAEARSRMRGDGSSFIERGRDRERVFFWELFFDLFWVRYIYLGVSEGERDSILVGKAAFGRSKMNI